MESFTVPSETYNKVSMQYYYRVGIPPPPLFPIKTVPSTTCGLDCHPLRAPEMVTLKHPPPPQNPKLHKYDKYDKAPYIVSSYR